MRNLRTALTDAFHDFSAFLEARATGLTAFFLILSGFFTGRIGLSHQSMIHFALLFRRAIFE
jgi:hypothetical protein